MLHVVSNTDHTERNFCKVMHSIIIFIRCTCPTASSMWVDAVDLLKF